MSSMRFGNPWHGKYSASGLTLENNALKTEWQRATVDPTDTYYVAFGMPEAPEPLISETALGMVWKNDMVLHGKEKRWTPQGGLAIGSNAWIYRATDGTVFKILVELNLASGGLVIRGQKIVGAVTTLMTSTVAIAAGNNYWNLNQSPTGDRCLLSIGTRVSSVTSLGESYYYVSKFDTVCELTLTGGSASALPSCSLATLYTNASRWEYNNWYNPANTVYTSPTYYELDEFIKQQTKKILFGYDFSGTRVVVSNKIVYWRKFEAQGPSTNNNQQVSDVSYRNEILVNNEVVYTAPVATLHTVENVPGGIVEDVRENWENFNTVFIYRLLSNCMAAFAVNTTDQIIEYVRTFYGSADGGLIGMNIGGGNASSVSLAAYNPRNGDVAIGINGGFI